MSYRVAEIAAWVEGTVHGDGDRLVTDALPIDEATATSISFIVKQNQLAGLANRALGALLLPETLVLSTQFPFPVIAVTGSPLSAMLTIASRFAPPAAPRPEGVDPRASVDPSATLGQGCSVGPFAVIEANVRIGDGCVIGPHAVVRSGCTLGANVEIHPHAVLYPNCRVGDNSVIHSGVVIGCDGYGYQFQDGRHKKVPQIGVVEIGSDVEIGANTTIDRATFGTTRVGDGCKIDNQVMIGHNCQIGKHNLLISQVGIAGSCVTGDYVTIAGQAGIADHVRIGERATVGANAGVHTDLEAGKAYLGSPARPERDAKRLVLTMEKLPEMRKQLHDIRVRLGMDDESGSARKAAG